MAGVSSTSTAYSLDTNQTTDNCRCVYGHRPVDITRVYPLGCQAIWPLARVTPVTLAYPNLGTRFDAASFAKLFNLDS